MPTKQETFDAVVAHLRRQGCRSENYNGCLYRADGGLKCAAGCLIPDDKYSPAMERRGVMSALGVSLAGNVISELGHDLALVKKLQQVHDFTRVPSWERDFRSVAAEFNLIYTPPVTEATP